MNQLNYENQVNKAHTAKDNSKDISLGISVIALILSGFAIYKIITVNHNPQNFYIVDTDLITSAYLRQVISKLKDDPVQLSKETEELVNKLNNIQNKLNNLSEVTGKILIRKSSVVSYPANMNYIDLTSKAAQDLNINIDNIDNIDQVSPDATADAVQDKNKKQKNADLNNLNNLNNLDNLDNLDNLNQLNQQNSDDLGSFLD